MKRTLITVALLFFACIALAQQQVNWKSLMQIAGMPTASPVVTWTFPYSNSLALYYTGDTNATGGAIDYSGWSRNASNLAGTVTTKVISTNGLGRIQRALVFNGKSAMTVAAGQANSTNFLGGYSFLPDTTSVVFYIWFCPTNFVNYMNLDGVGGSAWNWRTVAFNTVAAKKLLSIGKTSEAWSSVTPVSNTWYLACVRFRRRDTMNLNSDHIFSINAGTNSVTTSEKSFVHTANILLGRLSTELARDYQGYIGGYMCLTNLWPTETDTTNVWIYSHPTNNVMY